VAFLCYYRLQRPTIKVLGVLSTKSSSVPSCRKSWYLKGNGRLCCKADGLLASLMTEHQSHVPNISHKFLACGGRVRGS
jgi:hypothetical protein